MKNNQESLRGKRLCPVVLHKRAHAHTHKDRSLKYMIMYVHLCVSICVYMCVSVSLHVYKHILIWQRIKDVGFVAGLGGHFAT